MSVKLRTEKITCCLRVTVMDSSTEWRYPQVPCERVEQVSRELAVQIPFPWNSHMHGTPHQVARVEFLAWRTGSEGCPVECTYRGNGAVTQWESVGFASRKLGVQIPLAPQSSRLQTRRLRNVAVSDERYLTTWPWNRAKTGGVAHEKTRLVPMVHTQQRAHKPRRRISPPDFRLRFPHPRVSRAESGIGSWADQIQTRAPGLKPQGNNRSFRT